MTNSILTNWTPGRKLLACILSALLSCYMVPLSSSQAFADEGSVATGKTQESSSQNGTTASDQDEGDASHGQDASGSEDIDPSGETKNESPNDILAGSDNNSSGSDAVGDQGAMTDGSNASDEGALTEQELAGAFSNVTDADIAEVLSALEGNSAESDEAEGIATLSLNGSGSVNTFGGATMFETAVEEAKAAYSTSDTVILAGPGDAWVDALAAAGLAGALDCPILFTEQGKLHDATKKALLQMGVKNAVVVGGTAAVSDEVVAELADMGIARKARLGGTNCYDTQMKIYEYGLTNGLWASGTAIVATGGHYGDALSASPVAFAKKIPIFLVNNGTLPTAQKNALTAAYKSGNISSTVIVGGTAAVSSQTQGFLRELGSCERLGGATQYETSTEIAKWAVSKQGFSWNNAAFTTGAVPYDALAGSVLQGKSNSVMLLVGDTSSATIKEASINKSGISNIRFFGGTAAIVPSLRTYIMSCLSDTISYENTGVSYSKMLDLEYASAKNYKKNETEYNTMSDVMAGLNPGNFSYEDSSFYQFATINSGYSGKVTAVQVDAFIAKNCTYSESRYGVTSKLRGTGAFFIEAAKTYNVNEVYLVSHAILESAWGCSTLAQGKVSGYSGYLNFYGIGAYDLDPNNGGAALAKNNGWDTPEKAITGAAKWISEGSNGGGGYFNRGQNTLYKMRWNYLLVSSTGQVGGQYATSTIWATNIANVMANFYSSAGIDKSNTGLKYLVPLYS